MLSQMGLMIIFAMSYNMLMGQAGLLSFGHAVFFGLGGYCTAHALNAIKAQAMWLPIELVPLVGGLGGLFFAMSSAIQHQAARHRLRHDHLGHRRARHRRRVDVHLFFGGEGGMSTDRVIGYQPVRLHLRPVDAGLLSGRGWTVVAVVLMWLQTQTPLGRMANAMPRQFRAGPVRRLRSAHGAILAVRPERLFRRHRRRALCAGLRDRHFRHAGRDDIGQRAA